MNRDSEVIHVHERSIIKYQPFNKTCSVLTASADHQIPIWPCVTMNNGIGECEQQFPESSWPIEDAILWKVDQDKLLGESEQRKYQLIYVEFSTPRDGYCGFICFAESLS